MNIIVHVPNGQLEHFEDDKLKSQGAFWTLPRTPKRTKVGERINFENGGMLIGSAIIEDIIEGVMNCALTGNSFHGTHIVWDNVTFVREIGPVKGVPNQGFAYFPPPSL